MPPCPSRWVLGPVRRQLRLRPPELNKDAPFLRIPPQVIGPAGQRRLNTVKCFLEFPGPVFLNFLPVQVQDLNTGAGPGPDRRGAPSTMWPAIPRRTTRRNCGGAYPPSFSSRYCGNPCRADRISWPARPGLFSPSARFSTASEIARCASCTVGAVPGFRLSNWGGGKKFFGTGFGGGRREGGSEKKSSIPVLFRFGGCSGGSCTIKKLRLISARGGGCVSFPREGGRGRKKFPPKAASNDDWEKEWQQIANEQIASRSIRAP